MVIAGPTLKLSSVNASYEIGDTVDINCKLINPSTNEDMDVPPYMADFEMRASVKLDGVEIYNGAVKYTDEGKMVCPYVPKSSGDYEIEITMNKFDDVIKSEAPLKFNVVGPKLILSADKDVIGRGDEVEVTLKLKNPITSSELDLYETFDKCTVTAEVKIDGSAWKQFDVNVSKDKTGFKFTAPKKGEYAVTATIVSGNMTLESGIPLNITVKDPEYKLVSPKEEYHVNDGKVQFTLELYDVNGKETDECPEFLKEYKIYFVSGDYKSESVTFEKFIEDGCSFEYELKKAGEHKVKAVIEEGEDRYEFESVIKVKASEITVEGGIADLNKSTLGGSVTKEIALDEIFKDSDGDKLSYEVSSDNENVTWEVKEGKLILKVKTKTDGKVTVKATDGKGAEYTDEFSVSVKSTMPVLITVIIVVVVLAVTIPLTILIIKKRRIPRIKYGIKLCMNGNEAVFDINKASTNTKGKPVMTVKEILNVITLASEPEGDMSEEDRELMISNYCSKISITGFVFKNGIKVIFPNGKVKEFEKYTVTVPFEDDDVNNNFDISVSIGRQSDFHS